MMPYGSRRTLYGLYNRSIKRGRFYGTVEKKHPRQEGKKQIKEQLE